MGGPVVPRGNRLTPSGLVVAGVGFFLTRLSVTLVTTTDPLRFLLGGVVPLALGLSVAAYGVALTVGDFERGTVRTTALWCVAGTVGMGAFLAITLYGASPSAAMTTFSMGSETYLSNLLIGGCVGGTITGVFAARYRRQRLEQSAHAKRMVVLNHVFRDAVLNALTAMRGHLELLGDDQTAETRERAVGVLENQTLRLEDSVEEIRHLARGNTGPNQGLAPIRLDECIERTVADASEQFPEAEIDVEGQLPAVTVLADELLERVFGLVIENGVIHSDAETPRVTITCTQEEGVARVGIRDNGPGLPTAQQRMLAEGTIEEFDDPSTGFGLNVATLLAESYRGQLDASVTDGGTTIDVRLPLHSTAGANGPTAQTTNGVAKRRLALAGAAAIVAGVVMGVAIGAMGGSVPVIGALYGVPDPAVGWLTHEFHSIVFGLLYLVVLGIAPWGIANRHAGRIGLGAAWGIAIWLVAAGVIMPFWLQLVGIPATVPTLTVQSLVGHVVWGVSLGAVYSGVQATDAFATWSRPRLWTESG